MEHSAWLRMFHRLTADHVAADHAVSRLFPNYLRMEMVLDFDEFDKRRAVAEALQADWWNAINGDGRTVRALIERYGVGPQDDIAGNVKND